MIQPHEVSGKVYVFLYERQEIEGNLEESGFLWPSIAMARGRVGLEIVAMS